MYRQQIVSLERELEERCHLLQDLEPSTEREGERDSERRERERGGSTAVDGGGRVRGRKKEEMGEEERGREGVKDLERKELLRQNKALVQQVSWKSIVIDLYTSSIGMHASSIDIFYAFARDVPYSRFFHSAKFSLRAEVMDFHLLRTHMHHTYCTYKYSCKYLF